MPRYLLSYDLDKPGPQDYERLITEIKRFGGVEILRSQWVLRNDATAAALRDHFKGFIDVATDRLIVNELDNVWAGRRLMADINKL
jgi:hypothetical protein